MKLNSFMELDCRKEARSLKKDISVISKEHKTLSLRNKC
jgi:hypothetical protein